MEKDDDEMVGGRQMEANGQERRRVGNGVMERLEVSESVGGPAKRRRRKNSIINEPKEPPIREQ